MKFEKDTKTGLILPFNMSNREDRAEMFETGLPECLTLVFYQLYDDYNINHVRGPKGPLKGRDDWRDDEQRDLDYMAAIFRRVAESCIAGSPFPSIYCEVISTADIQDDFDLMSWVPISQRQKDWAIDGIRYLQAGFFHYDEYYQHLDPRYPIFAAMTVYDRIYADTGAMIPQDQEPMEADAKVEAKFRLYVNDIFKERIGVWCRDLVDLRNEVMVKVRATLYGDDPDEEWKKFREAGFIHYLDYLKIWTPPKDEYIFGSTHEDRSTSG